MRSMIICLILALTCSYGAFVSAAEAAGTNGTIKNQTIDRQQDLQDNRTPREHREHGDTHERGMHEGGAHGEDHGGGHEGGHGGRR